MKVQQLAKKKRMPWIDFVSLPRHPNAAQTGQSNLYPERMGERIPGWCEHSTARRNELRKTFRLGKRFSSKSIKPLSQFINVRVDEPIEQAIITYS